jgi:hypothetical protein
MNAELISALRYCGGTEKYCKLCPSYDTCHATVDGLKQILCAAADALEAAEKRIDELEAQIPKEGDRISKWDIALLNTFDNDRHNLLARCKCIKCGKDITVLATNIPNYCPDCGARMKGGQE